MKSRHFGRQVFVPIVVCFMGVSCGTQKTDSELSHVDSVQKYAAQPLNFRVSLTDKPDDDLSSVVVDVAKVEILLAKSGRQVRVVLTQGLGPIDFLKLQNGILLPLQGMTLPVGTEVKEVRLVLEGAGHYALRQDGSVCDMKTPSGQKSGVKLKFTSPMIIEGGYTYSLVVDFDVKHSVVQQGNGRCLLKPVLKVKQATRIPLPPPGTTPTTQPGGSLPGDEEDVPTEGDQDGDEGGFESPSTTQPPVIEVPPEDLPDYLY